MNKLSEEEILNTVKNIIRQLNGDTHYLLDTNFNKVKALERFIRLI